MRRISMLIALTAGSLGASAAQAQTDQIAMAHQSAANQLGIMEYCQAQGYTDQSAIVAQRSVIARMPASAAPTDAAEASGRQGTLVANGTSYTLAAMATRGNTTEPALCKQMASNVTQIAAMQQQNGMGMGMPVMPRMPAMPGGMPAMPGNMPAMPAMPTMPTLPH